MEYYSIRDRFLINSMSFLFLRADDDTTTKQIDVNHSRPLLPRARFRLVSPLVPSFLLSSPQCMSILISSDSGPDPLELPVFAGLPSGVNSVIEFGGREAVILMSAQF